MSIDKHGVCSFKNGKNGIMLYLVICGYSFSFFKPKGICYLTSFIWKATTHLSLCCLCYQAGNKQRLNLGIQIMVFISDVLLYNFTLEHLILKAWLQVNNLLGLFIVPNSQRILIPRNQMLMLVTSSSNLLVTSFCYFFSAVYCICNMTGIAGHTPFFLLFRAMGNTVINVQYLGCTIKMMAYCTQSHKPRMLFKIKGPNCFFLSFLWVNPIKGACYLSLTSSSLNLTSFQPTVYGVCSPWVSLGFYSFLLWVCYCVYMVLCDRLTINLDCISILF